MEIKKKIGAVIWTALSVVLFWQLFYYSMLTLRDAIWPAVSAAEVETLPVEPAALDVGVGDYWSTLYTDSRGATAYGWEIEECIRELMLEAGGESEEDIREHAAVYCKQLLYTQTVGGYDDWGLTLHEVVHSHGYAETWPNIWTPAAEPTDTVREIFWDVWNNGYTSDFRVQSFRSVFYASWSIPAFSIGNTYYGINPWQDFSAWGY